MNNTNSSLVNNFAWRFMERWGAQGVTLVVSIILARLLDPDVYGLLALVTVFTNLLQVFIDSGLGTALIQKKDADDLDFSTVFWFNLGMCLLLYLLLYFMAPAIAGFYRMTDLIPVIRVLGLTLIISGIKGIQQSYVARNMLFKRFFFSTLAGTIGAAVLGIFLAYRGFGVWALVAQYLFNNLIDTIILWITVRWRPKLLFSSERFIVLFRFGWKMLLSTLIDSLYNNLRSLVIGKIYTSEDLAFYNKGKQFPELAVTNINSALNSVLLPAMANQQDDTKEIKNMAKRVIKISSFVIWPLMIGLCVVANSFITILLTSKWLPCVIFLQIACFEQALQPLQTTNLSVVKALGKADYHLIIEIIKKTIAIILVIVSAFIGVRAIAISAVVYAIIASVINAFPNKKLIDYSYFEQIKDIAPYILCSCIMGAGAMLVGTLIKNYILQLIVEVFVGIFIYVSLAVAFRFDSFYYILDTLKRLRKKRIDA